MSADTLTTDGGAVVLPGATAAGSNIPPGSYAETGYVALPGQDEVVVLSEGTDYQSTAVINGYSLSGQPLFQTNAFSSYGGHSDQLRAASIFAVGSSGQFGIAINTTYYGGTANYYDLFTPAGTAGAGWTPLDANYQALPAVGSDTPSGFHLEWVTAQPVPGNDSGPYAGAYADFSADGTSQGAIRTAAASTMPYAASGTANFTIAVRDNQLSSGAKLPGEPAASVTSVAIAWLQAHQGTAAVAWADSGTDYVSIWNGPTDSFGPAIGLDWGGASDLHAVALPDGGFAVSWMNGGAYKGEVFDLDGHGGGVISLTGDVAGIASNGDLYTVGLNSSGQYVVQDYAINASGGSAGGSGSAVATSAADYTAPDGVTTITLTGSNQTIHANNAGDTIFSDNTVNHLYGGTGNDTFHLGRGGDIATGGGGNDVFAYAEVPWNPGQITDFGSGDVIDLTGLLHQAGYDGNDPVGAHYLDISPTIQGAELQVYAFGQLWNIGYVDNVAASDLQVTGDLVTLAGSGGTPQTSVTTSDASYTAPSYVTSITLTGSQQTIDARPTNGVTINSNDTGNTLIGGAGNDVFHLGRGGDIVTGNGGADTFAFAAIPWSPDDIHDFHGAEGDQIDVTGLLSQAGYTGSDPFADGYLKFTSADGGAELWGNYHLPGNDGWWLVVGLDAVSASSLHYSGGLIT